MTVWRQVVEFRTLDAVERLELFAHDAFGLITLAESELERRNKAAGTNDGSYVRLGPAVPVPPEDLKWE